MNLFLIELSFNILISKKEACSRNEKLFLSYFFPSWCHKLSAVLITRASQAKLIAANDLHAL